MWIWIKTHEEKEKVESFSAASSSLTHLTCAERPPHARNSLSVRGFFNVHVPWPMRVHLPTCFMCIACCAHTSTRLQCASFPACTNRHAAGSTRVHSNSPMHVVTPMCGSLTLHKWPFPCMVRSFPSTWIEPACSPLAWATWTTGFQGPEAFIFLQVGVKCCLSSYLSISSSQLSATWALSLLCMNLTHSLK